MSATELSLLAKAREAHLGRPFLKWERTLIAASNGSATNAPVLYAEAQKLAQRLFDSQPWKNCHCSIKQGHQQAALEASLIALTMTCHCRARLYQQQHQYIQAGNCYRQAYAFVKNLLSDALLPNHLYSIVIRHLLFTLAMRPLAAPQSSW